MNKIARIEGIQVNEDSLLPGSVNKIARIEAIQVNEDSLFPGSVNEITRIAVLSKPTRSSRAR